MHYFCSYICLLVCIFQNLEGLNYALFFFSRYQNLLQKLDVFVVVCRRDNVEQFTYHILYVKLYSKFINK